jgi:hypothetical protein
MLHIHLLLCGAHILRRELRHSSQGIGGDERPAFGLGCVDSSSGFSSCATAHIVLMPICDAEELSAYPTNTPTWVFPSTHIFFMINSVLDLNSQKGKAGKRCLCGKPNALMGNLYRNYGKSVCHAVLKNSEIIQRPRFSFAAHMFSIVLR